MKTIKCKYCNWKVGFNSQQEVFRVLYIHLMRDHWEKIEPELLESWKQEIVDE